MNTRSPKRLCRHPGCRTLHMNRGGYCDAHLRKREHVEQRQDRDMRGSAAERGYDHNWTKIRAQKLNADPLCERCEARGRVTPAAVVHHRDHDQFNNRSDNLESLCRVCHERHHERLIQGCDENGVPMSAKHHWREKR